MPNKFETELQFKRLFKSAVHIDFLYLKTHQTSDIKRQYIESHYIPFDVAKHRFYDAVILTGAPVEQLSFEAVDYYEELTQILDWSKQRNHARLFICWGAQFALYHLYNIKKQSFPGNRKLFGVYPYDIVSKNPLTDGFHHYFSPQSRYTNINIEDIRQKADLTILSSHPEYGADIIISSDNKDIYINGHLEYNPNTLHTEYIRDCNKGIQIALPEHYYEYNNSSNLTISHWQPFAETFFNRWIKQLMIDNQTNYTYFNKQFV